MSRKRVLYAIAVSVRLFVRLFVCRLKRVLLLLSSMTGRIVAAPPTSPVSHTEKLPLVKIMVAAGFHGVVKFFRGRKHLGHVWRQQQHVFQTTDEQTNERTNKETEEHRRLVEADTAIVTRRNAPNPVQNKKLCCRKEAARCFVSVISFTTIRRPQVLLPI